MFVVEYFSIFRNRRGARIEVAVATGRSEPLATATDVRAVQDQTQSINRPVASASRGGLTEIAPVDPDPLKNSIGRGSTEVAPVDSDSLGKFINED